MAKALERAKKRPPKGDSKADPKGDQKPMAPPVWKLYSSPLERATETAESIAKALGLEVLIRPGLNETNCGDWAGKTVKSLSRRKVWKTIQTNPSQFQFPGGESFTGCQQRIVEEVEAIRALHAPHDTIVCVSHADPLKLLIAHYLGLPFDYFQRLMIGPASLTIMHLDEAIGRLLALNISPSFYLSKP